MKVVLSLGSLDTKGLAQTQSLSLTWKEGREGFALFPAPLSQCKG